MTELRECHDTSGFLEVMRLRSLVKLLYSPVLQEALANETIARTVCVVSQRIRVIRPEYLCSYYNLKCLKLNLMKHALLYQSRDTSRAYCHVIQLKADDNDV